MRVSSAVAALLLAGVFALAGAGFAADDPPEGRVPLVIRAADPDGGALQFNWTQKEGPNVQIADPHAARFDKVTQKWISETYFVPTLPGKYVFEVTVKNEYGLESSKRFVQEILPAVPLPEANPGANFKKKLGEKVTLSGVESKAFGNRVVTRYEWSVRQAPGDFALTKEQVSSRQVEFMPKAPGKYIFELKVFDGKYWGETASVEVDVTPREGPKIDTPEMRDPVVLDPPVKINGTNNAPKTKAVGFVKDGDKPFKIGDKIVLDGSRSVANDADAPAFLWFQLKDNTPVVKSFSADTTRPFSPGRTDQLNYPVQTFIVAENGTYKFALQIKLKDDTSVESEPVTVQVGTGTPPDPPQAPLVAVLTVNKTSVPVGQEVTLDGSKSRSATNGKLKYIWMQVGGKNFPTIRGDGDTPIARASADREGEYAVVLVVKDGDNVAKSEPIVFTVTAGEKPPVIDLDKTLTSNAGETVNIEARVTDPQNYPVTVKWTCLEPASMNEKLAPVANLKRFQFTPTKAGTFLFQIEATNSKGMTATAQIQVGVKDAAQLKPTAVVMGPEKANIGEKVTLSAAQSHSPNKTPLTYTWRDESPGGAKIKDIPPRTAKEWTFTVTEPGRVLVTLVVNDGKADSEPYKFAVEVAGPKAKPVAKISGPRNAMAKMEVELSADGSSAPDNGALQYFWSQPADGGGPDLMLTPAQRRGKMLRFVPPKAGMYVIQLAVADQNNERSETEQFTLEVKAAPTPAPTAAAVVLNNGPLAAGKEVRLSAKDSVGAAGAALTYKWKQTKGEALVLARDNTQEISVTPAKAGTYEFQVIAIDGEQESAPVTVSFMVAAGALPKADIAEIVQPNAGDTVVLDGTGSKSPNGAGGGDALQFEWKQVKGEPVRLPLGEDKKPKIQFTVPVEGEYVWELRVFDGTDWSEPRSIAFTAKGTAKNQAPVAIVDKPVITTEVGVETTIDATKSNDPDAAPNKALTYRWRRGEQVFNETGAVLKFTPPAVGTLQFSVQAFDGKDYSQPAQVVVNVLAPGVLPVAKPKVVPNPAIRAVRGGPNNQNRIIILDGTESLPPRDKPERQLTYMWKQTEGDNLTLAPTAMAKDRVGLYIYKTGIYKFQLTVNDSENSSLPVEVELKVEDEKK